MVYLFNTSNIQEVLNKFNNLKTSMQFTTEEESENKINFLGITIAKEETNINLPYTENPLQQISLSQKDHVTPQGIN